MGSNGIKISLRPDKTRGLVSLGTEPLVLFDALLMVSHFEQLICIVLFYPIKVSSKQKYVKGV